MKKLINRITDRLLGGALNRRYRVDDGQGLVYMDATRPVTPADMAIMRSIATTRQRTTHSHWYVWRLSDNRIGCEASYGPFSSRRDADECEYALREEVGDVFYVSDVAGRTPNLT